MSNSPQIVGAEKAQETTIVENKQLPGHVNAGAVAIEQERAIAEARGQIQLAKMFPRSVSQAIEEFMEACKNPEFAEAAFYSVPNRGSGPSIRFAEEAARCYGNFEYGHRELSRSDGKSEVEVYAWDKEKNNVSKRQITVDHVRYTRSNGNTKLVDPADIDNRIANIASKQMRGRILALLSKSLVAMGVSECQRTLAGENQQSIKARVQKMISAFSNYGVTTKHLADYIGHSVDVATADDIATLTGVFNALREGAKVADYFSAPKLTESPAAADDSDGGKTASNDNDKGKGKGKAPAATKPAGGSKRKNAAAKNDDKDKAPPKEEEPAEDEKPQQEEAPEQENQDAGDDQQPDGAEGTEGAAEGGDDDFDDMFAND